MDLTSKVNRLLAEFAGRIGLPSLSLDEEGMASFNRHWHRFDLHFGFDELTGKVQLYAQILAAQLTLECFEATLANLLDHAEFWQRLLPCDSDREAVAAVGMRV
ncbi:CesT family type III secretion system chaperone [Pseudomonas aeruginosa]|uniref:CesT family type III secretion system chaperone n=1 Tax=Pseudomonas aeruginosa TaxID=287 RepID=UPI001049CD4B|nr:CesT family type III secretion system chaperone [Pseudomonas aeruginosa]